MSIQLWKLLVHILKEGINPQEGKHSKLRMSLVFNRARKSPSFIAKMEIIELAIEPNTQSLI